jgi:uncharacterized protein (DUF2126 family)
VFRQIWEWRFPPLLEVVDEGGAAQLTLRPALEPWPLICDFPREGGFTSRFVDASLRRFEVSASASFRRSGELWLNGRPLPLPPADAQGEDALLAVRFRQQRLYPCLHPAIDPHLPLQLQVRTPTGRRGFQLNEAGNRFEELSAPLDWPETAPPWQGRQHPDDRTIDLRLD